MGTTVVCVGSRCQRRWTLDQLAAWGPFRALHPEAQRRLLAILEAGGGRIGVSNIARSVATQTAQRLLRPRLVASWRRSYHVRDRTTGVVYAVDFSGDLKLLEQLAPAHGWRISTVEPWHGQLVELPASKRVFNRAPWRYQSAIRTTGIEAV